MKELKFILLWKNFLKHIHSSIVISHKKEYFLYFLSIIIALFVSSFINVKLTDFQRNWVNALESKDVSLFQRELFFYACSLISFVMVVALAVYLQGRLSIVLRKQFSESIISKYLNSYNYYKISSHKVIDNPDQRISEDVKLFAQKTLDVVVDIFSAVIHLILFGNVLRAISNDLLVAAIGVSVVATLFSLKYFGNKFSTYNYAQNKKEADYRSSLIQVRDNTESIAFHRGEPYESIQIKSRLQEAVLNSLGLNFINGEYTVFFMGISMLSNIIPIMMMSGDYLLGKYGIGDILRVITAFGMVRASFNVIIKTQGTISAASASMSRINQLLEKTKEKENTLSYSRKIILNNIDLSVPNDNKMLLKDFTLEIKRGVCILIKGESGIGKTSIFRILSHIWEANKGEIKTIDSNRMYFIPQQSYMPIGTLRQQLLYPDSILNISDKKIINILEKVRLSDLPNRVGGLNTLVNLTDILSAGERQRYAIVRALLHSPEYMFLDEATSALDENDEAIIYTELKRRRITYITIGHNDRLNKFHQKVIELFPNNTYNTYAT